MNTKKRLGDVRAETLRLREALRILDEQVAHAESVAADAETRAVVSSTPLADRERRAAVEDLRRVRRERDDTAARLDELAAEQDVLLERLLGEGGGWGSGREGGREAPAGGWRSGYGGGS